MESSSQSVSIRIRKLILGIIGTLSMTGAISGLALWKMSPGTTSPFLDARGNIAPESVAEIVNLPLGGSSQFVLMRGRNVSNPVLLLLHGGPGDPHAPQFGHYNSALEDHFIVVHWDQRGAGRSYSASISPKTMTVVQLIADTHELTAYLKTRFFKRKILLAGHSWGSYLGIHVAERYPQDYWAYVGIGQVANQRESETVSYRTLLDHARTIQHVEAIEELEKIGPPERGRYRGGIAGLARQRKWLREFGGLHIEKATSRHFGSSQSRFSVFVNMAWSTSLPIFAVKSFRCPI